ncbi:TolC family protein [Filimonas effusa]|uniref:TolC family protein n=1 Tax=Filimonas effusa TaxID=2508721 RepID=A0A4V1M9N4_9BACT|nr:TolC family protein [Filimonas effusa]RXK81820.1 hypothetical protein ESB13_18690 [Filimonas effusa]
MCKLLKHIYLLAIFCAACTLTRAQESMLKDVDYALLQKLIQTAKANYPRVKQMQHQTLAVKASLDATRLAWFDILSFSYLYSPNNSTTLVNPSLFNGYQIGISLNLGSILQKGPNVRRAREEYYMALENQAEYMLSLEAQVKQRYFLYVQQLAAIRLRTYTVTDLEQTMQETRYKYEKGEATLDELNRNMTALTDQNNSKMTAESAFLIAKSSLEELLGKPLEEVK